LGDRNLFRMTAGYRWPWPFCIAVCWTQVTMTLLHCHWIQVTVFCISVWYERTRLCLDQQPVTAVHSAKFRGASRIYNHQVSCPSSVCWPRKGRLTPQ